MKTQQTIIIINQKLSIQPKMAKRLFKCIFIEKDTIIHTSLEGVRKFLKILKR